eukprot:scaffold16043_cov115-Isochrysis_galbana.AAC.15
MARWLARARRSGWGPPAVNSSHMAATTPRRAASTGVPTGRAKSYAYRSSSLWVCAPSTPCTSSPSRGPLIGGSRHCSRERCKRDGLSCAAAGVESTRQKGSRHSGAWSINPAARRARRWPSVN